MRFTIMDGNKINDFAVNSNLVGESIKKKRFISEQNGREMNLMTDSKVIQQADEAEQFQENPHYFHRNIDPAQVNCQIQFVSKDVTSFINKLHRSNLCQNQTSEKPQRVSQDCANNQFKHYRVPKLKSQIDQISFNTQSLIEDLSWMNTTKQINRVYKLQSSDKRSICDASQVSFANHNESFRKQGLKNRSASRKSYQKDCQEHSQTNSKSVNVSRAKFQRESKTNLPKTIDIFKANSNFNLPQHSCVAGINKIYFDTGKKVDFLDQFDDKDTVVNQPQSNGRRKYTKTKVKNQLKKESIEEQNYGKLTKKKLLQKIVNLQTQFKHLKNQQETKKYINYRQNQPLQTKFFQKEPKSQPSFIEDIEIKVNQKVGRKYTIDQINSKSKMLQIPQKKNTLSYLEKDNRSRNTHEPSRKQSQTSSSQRKKSCSKIADKERISLRKWVSEVWDDL